MPNEAVTQMLMAEWIRRNAFERGEIVFGSYNPVEAPKAG